MSLTFTLICLLVIVLLVYKKWKKSNKSNKWIKKSHRYMIVLYENIDNTDVNLSIFELGDIYKTEVKKYIMLYLKQLFEEDEDYRNMNIKSFDNYTKSGNLILELDYEYNNRYNSDNNIFVNWSDTGGEGSIYVNGKEYYIDIYKYK